MARDYAHPPLAMPSPAVPRPHYAAGVGLLLLGLGNLVVILLVLPRYLASSDRAAGSTPVASPVPVAAVPSASSPHPEPGRPAAGTVLAAVADTVPAVEEVPEARPAQAPARSIDLPNLQFEQGLAGLSPAAKEILGRLAMLLRQRPELHVTLSGHTDDLGTIPLNRALSLQRAQNARLWLRARRVPASRIEIEGFGSTHPIEQDRSAQARAINRRVEVVLR